MWVNLVPPDLSVTEICTRSFTGFKLFYIDFRFNTIVFSFFGGDDDKLFGNLRHCQNANSEFANERSAKWADLIV